MRPDDRGTSVPLIIAFTAILLVLVAAVVDASAAYLAHQQVDALADGAALRGADLAAQGGDTYAGGVGAGPLALTREEARRGVLDYLRGAVRDHPGLRATVRVTGGRVVVVLTAPFTLPLHLPGAPVRSIVRSTGSAEVRPDVGAGPG